MKGPQKLISRALAKEVEAYFPLKTARLVSCSVWLLAKCESKASQAVTPIPSPPRHNRRPVSNRRPPGSLLCSNKRLSTLRE
ncbi:hypothetical protein Syun_015855 [Stephania yunnanensis]|uniref:Uncharacterized protein n=1 Tax=Stephania yunnanensis TaxID=152371 RepID=A0AAP0P1P6_9MAGN